MKIRIEFTDTFGDEPNFSWVRRESLDIPENSSEEEILRHAKTAVGLQDTPCDVSQFGDTLEIRPQGQCTVVFVDFPEETSP